MIGFFIAMLSGALMSIQGVFNTQVTKATSIWVASGFVQFTALLVCLGAWAVADRSSFLKIGQVSPKYMLLGGAIGNFIDRLLLGYVTDMFATTFMNFAVFNVADIGVVVGGVLLCVHVLFFMRGDKGAAKA